MLVKLAITCIICIVGILLIYVTGVLLISLFTEFKPAQAEQITLENEVIKVLQHGQEFSVLTWNIGYGGLGKEMDFFYEGGQKTRPDDVLSKKYLEGITDFLGKKDTLDFILLQEVDFDAKRSYGVNQAHSISAVLPDFKQISTVNYFSKYIPVPFFNPMGNVKSGLVTFSRYSPSDAIRLSTPGKYSFPTRLFMLKRCLLVTRYAVGDGKELVLINLHNSAFEDADELRKKELKFIKQFILQEYGKGNYVIAGGDWNQNPPGLNLNSTTKYKTRSVWPIENDFMAIDWNWAFDPSVPTNRDVSEPFDLETTPCTFLDFFVTSPNIEVIETKTVDLEFEDADHQPVMITLKLK